MPRHRSGNRNRKRGKGGKGGKGGRDGGKDDDDAEENSRHLMAMTFADVLKDDILQIGCLACDGVPAEVEETEEIVHQLCQCAATLHPFCFVFHRWVRLRLTGVCSSTPSEAIALKEQAASGLAADDGDSDGGDSLDHVDEDEDSTGSSDEESSKALDPCCKRCSSLPHASFLSAHAGSVGDPLRVPWDAPMVPPATAAYSFYIGPGGTIGQAGLASA